MSDFRRNAIAILAADLDGPNRQDDETRERLIELLCENFTERQLAVLEETFAGLSDRAYTARRRVKAATDRQKAIGRMSDDELVTANPGRSLVGAVAFRPTLKVVEGGDAA